MDRSFHAGPARRRHFPNSLFSTRNFPFPISYFPFPIHTSKAMPELLFAIPAIAALAAAAVSIAPALIGRLAGRTATMGTS